MKLFCQDIVERYLASDRWPGLKLSALEQVICSECMDPEDADRIRDHNLRLMLEDIDRRKAEAVRYGSGEKDWLLSRFRAGLEAGRHREKEVYSRLRQGLSSGQIAAELGIPEETVKDAKIRLLRLYRKSHGQNGEVSRPGEQTLGMLLEGQYRIFRRAESGRVRYRFYHRDRLLGSADAERDRDFSMVLRCGSGIYNSRLDPEQTLFPGVFRPLVDADDPAAEFARLVFRETGEHELLLSRDTGRRRIRILSEGNDHSFFAEGRLLARIIAPEIPQSISGWNLMGCMKVYQPVPEDLAVILLSFPIMRIGI